MALMEYWGKQSEPGSLSNLRSYINRTLFDKYGKKFNVADEFLVHAFKAYLLAAICTHLKVSSLSEPVPHEKSLEWLSSTAKSIVGERVSNATGESGSLMCSPSLFFYT